MSAASKLALIGVLAALAACANEPDDRNIAVANEVPPDAEVEVLPPDESVITPSDELRAGAQDPHVNELPANAQ